MAQKHVFGSKTRFIHGKTERHNGFRRAHVDPIFQTSTFRYESVEEGERIFSGQTHYDAYSRVSNPNYRHLEEKLCILENGEAAQVFDSGMSAIKTAVLTLTKSGDHIIAHRNLYGSTVEFLENIKEFGIDTTFVDARDVINVTMTTTSRTKIIFLESPSNPMLDICDFAHISQITHAANSNIVVILDNTFATPINQTPLDHGVDIVIHSLTKYINGFGTHVGGALITSQKLMDKMWERYSFFGGIMSPMVAWDIANNMLTLDDRMHRHNMNAQKVTYHLSTYQCQHLKSIHYPGLKDHPNHLTASMLMSDYGGMVSFELHDPDGRNTTRFLNRLSEDQANGEGVISQAVSLGNVDTLICCPARSTHFAVPKEKRLTQGLTDNLIRLSVGIEDISDIIYSLDRAFETIKY